MGNASAVAEGVKKQGDSGARELYKLVDLKGGGSLVDLMKKAKWTKDYRPLDTAISTEVVQFLINGGEGEYVLISELVKARSEAADRTPKTKTSDEKNRRHTKCKQLACCLPPAKIDMEMPAENYLKKKTGNIHSVIR